jgi:hypothetical protein
MSEAAAAASGDANMGSANVDMRPADTDMGPARAKVGASNVAATKVAPAEVPAASVAAASMAASTPSKGCRWDCGATQKDSGDGHDHCFSKHRSLLVVFRSIKVSICACSVGHRREFHPAVDQLVTCLLGINS